MEQPLPPLTRRCPSLAQVHACSEKLLMQRVLNVLVLTVLLCARAVGPLRWQLLCELLGVAMKMVTLRSSCGAVRDARGHCMEALKLATKLQAVGT